MIAQVRTPEFKQNDTILFIGDSVTDCARRGQCAPLGEGYVKIFQELMTALHPELNLRVMNKGIGGNTVTDLRNRWHDDVMRHDFNWLSVKIGINDLHRNCRGGLPEFTVAKFQEDYDAILEQTVAKKGDAKLILIDPFYISTDFNDQSFRGIVLKLLPEYLDVVEQLSQKYKALHLKTHDMFQRLLQNHDPDEFCPEPVHPNRAGHLAMALHLYQLLSH